MKLEKFTIADLGVMLKVIQDKIDRLSDHPDNLRYWQDLSWKKLMLSKEIEAKMFFIEWPIPQKEWYEQIKRDKIEEHDIVEIIASGEHGTVVHIFPKAEAFIVELPNNSTPTLTRYQIKKIDS